VTDNHLGYLIGQEAGGCQTPVQVEAVVDKAERSDQNGHAESGPYPSVGHHNTEELPCKSHCNIMFDWLI